MGVHEQNIDLNWVKQLRNVLFQLQGDSTLAKTNINIKERARPKACKTKEQDLQLVTLVRNEFLQRCISSTFAKKSSL